MLQIPAEKSLVSYSYEEMVNRYLSGADHQPEEISYSDWVNQMDKRLRHEQFYVICDVKTGSIRKCNGLSLWLDYPESSFTRKTFNAMISNSHMLSQSIFAAALFDTLAENNFRMKDGDQICSATIAIRTRANNDIYCKRDSYAVSVSQEGKLLQYIDVFTLIKHFSNEAFHIRLSHADADKALKIFARKRFEESGWFSIQEMRILKRYAKNPRVTSGQIARSFKIEKGTVETYNKRIMKKSATVFGQHFDSARHAAAYFSGVQLI